MSKKLKFNYNQPSLPFDEKAAKTLALSLETRERIFMILLSFSLLSIGTYIYAVNATAHHVAERASLEGQSAELTTELATLEFQYIDLRGQVTLDTAKGLGFAEVKNPVYVSKNGANSLSFNTVNR